MRKLYVRGFSIFPPRCQTPLFITVFSSLRGRGTRTNLYKKEVMILQKEQFDITGMTCSACSTRVEKSVAKLPGIKEVSVNLLKNSMVASYDESVLDTAGIVQAVEKAGYGAIPKASAQNKSRTTTPAAKPEVSTAQVEYKQMKQRLLLSALFTIPLFYISMGHMMGWPLPSSLLGMENAISFALADEKASKLKLKEYQDALISGVQLDTILYFEDWADTWFEGHKDNIAPTTQESYKYCLKMLKEGFYHRPLTIIRPIDIENFLKGMRRDGRSDSYISKARGMLYQIFQKAEANDLVRRNPVRLAEKMRASGTAKRKEAFTTAEVAHLMKVLPDDRMGLSIRLLLGTGMRMQELLALEPQFIEEDGSVIHIRQAVKVVKGTVSIGSPKSKDSIRDIPVPLNVRPCAIKLRDTTDQFIWESPKTGLPCNPTHFRDVFRKSLEEAGDVRLLTPHSCRHTYVSQMQALGVDIQTIQSIVGHADTEMTEHYLHVQESIRQSAIQLFSEAFSA